jgi:hypothetical protein
MSTQPEAVLEANLVKHSVDKYNLTTAPMEKLYMQPSLRYNTRKILRKVKGEISW